MERDPLKSLYSMFDVFGQRKTLGPGLIVLGCAILYFVFPREADSASPLLYGFAILLGIVVLAGIVITFQELRRSQILSETEPMPDSSSGLEHAVNQLNKNYEILRGQTTQGFVLSAVFMILGLLVILSGSIGELFGFVENGNILTSVAGIILEFISGTALAVYRSNFNRLNKTSDRLHQTWKILTAFREAEKLPEEEKTKATLKLIDALITQ